MGNTILFNVSELLSAVERNTFTCCSFRGETVTAVETIKHTENQFKEESMFSSINVLKGAITWLRFANIER